MTCLAYDPTQDKKLILRVHRPSYHSKQEIKSELLWIIDLRKNNIIVTPKPIETKKGKLIASFKTHDNIERNVVAFTFMAGKEPSRSDELVDGFKKLGAITARLHNHTESWQRPVSFIRKTWNYETMLGSSPLWGQWRHALGLTNLGQETIHKACLIIKRRLEEYGMGKKRFGLVHADLRLANLIIDDSRLGVIDFDDCGFSWFMYDFAAAISFIEDDPIIYSLQSAWIEGYRDNRPLFEEDEQMFSTFITLRRILLTAWLASHKETPTAEELGDKYTQGTVKIAMQYIIDNQ